MRKLILQMQTSLDMFVGAKDGTDWMVWGFGDDWTWDEDLRQYHIDTTASADTVLLSNRMAQEGFIDHWAAMAERSDNPQHAFARNITRAQKVICSHTTPEIRWSNAVAGDGDLVTTVNELKQQPGKNIIVFGGAGFAASLIAAGLVDEFHFITNPVILGDGLSIFPETVVPFHFTHLQTTSYSQGITVSQWRKSSKPSET